MTVPLLPLSPFPTLVPAPIETLAILFFTPLMDPIPVGTRLPPPADDEPYITSFFKVESAGGVQLNEYQYEQHLILHSYNLKEADGEQIGNLGTGAGGNALGWSGVARGVKYYVGWSRVIQLSMQQTDPLVNLPRYRSMVGWTIIGNPL